MPQLGDNSLGESLASRTIPPPPPTGNLEVVIRTLASDLELIGTSGGALRGGSGTVSVVGAGGKITAGPAAFDASGSGMPTVHAPVRDNTQVIIWAIVAVVGTIILFLVGYYFIPLIVNTGKNTPPPQSGPSTSGGAGSGTGMGTGTGITPKPAPQPTFLGHATFFRTPTPAVDFNVYVNGLPPDRPSFINTLTTVTQAYITAGKGSFYEMIPHGVNDTPYAWSDLTALLGAGSIGQDFLSTNFERDYTAFVFASGTNMFPGYVFKLQKSKNPLLLQRDALTIESNLANLSKLFFVDPGAAAGTFQDTQISGQPTRTLTFTSGTDSATKIQTLRWGWFFNQYLIVSTSDEGLRNALERL